MKICDINLCTGCGLCANVCPVRSIFMKENTIGHLYPNVDENKCIQCKRCIKECPINSSLKTYNAKQAFACWSLEPKIRRDSTSGGFATVIATYFLLNGGIVYGCSLFDQKIRHVRIDNLTQLSNFKGSKYVESPIYEIIPNIINDLKNCLNVLFIGTPCQCGAIKQAIGGNDKNLLTIELICSGVPPQKLLWEHLRIDNIDSIKFRDNIGTRITVKSNGNIVYQQPVWRDYFLMGFSKHLYFRNSCYNCKYANRNRVSDMTIGDFWGLGSYVPFTKDVKDGVSVLIINNEKGQDYFNNIKEYLYFEERPLEEAIQGNPRYFKPSEKHINSEAFIDFYVRHGFKTAIKKALRKEITKYRLYSLYREIKKFYIFHK